MAILRGIKFTTALAALVLFFLPWVEIQRADRLVATQTGLQTIGGQATPGPGQQANRQQAALGSAPMVGIAFGMAGLAVILLAMGMHFDHLKSDLLGSGLCALGLMLLLAQAIQEFPARQAIMDSITSDQAALQGEMADFMMVVMMKQLEVTTLSEFTVTCVLLGVPALLGMLQLAAVLKLKKSAGMSALLLLSLCSCGHVTRKGSHDVETSRIKFVEVATEDEDTPYIPNEFITKWENIVIPSVCFEGATLEDTIEFLRQRSVELDPEEDHHKKGISWVVRAPSGGGAGYDAALERVLELPVDADAVRINLRAKNMKMVDLIQEISEQASLNSYLTSRGFLMIPEEQKFNVEYERSQGIELWRVYREAK